MKILLIDDDQDLATVFETALKNDGFEVVKAVNGAEGIEKAKTGKPDFILLDQVLPDMQGNEALKTLKEDPQTQSIPVAMLSNFGQNELIDEAIKTGAIDYILKYQIEAKDLTEKVKRFTKESQANPVA